MPRVVPVSLVIPTRDRPDLLRSLLTSVFAGSCLPAELIVADQSRDRATLPAAPDGVHVTHLDVRSVGLSRNRNAAIAVATQDVLVFTDDDSEVDRDWLCELYSAIDRAPARTVVTGAVLPGSNEGTAPSLTSATAPTVVRGRITGGDPLFPNNMAVPRSAFDEVGDFDVRLGAGAPWFPAAEDNDFGFRLLEAGFAIAFVPDAVIRHVGVRHGRARAALEWAYGRGQGAFYAKHMRWSDGHMLRRLWLNVAERLASLPRLLRGDRAAARECIYLAGLLVGAVGWRIRYPRAFSRRSSARGES